MQQRLVNPHKANDHLEIWSVAIKLFVEPMAHSLEGLFPGAAALCFARLAGML